MRRRPALALAFAVCCLFVLTSLSASLETTVSTTPDEATDLDFEGLPLSVGEASELKETYESGPQDDGDSAESGQSDSRSRNPSDGSGSDSSSSSSSGAESESSSASGSEGSGSGGGGPSQNEDGTALGPPGGLWATLYNLLLTLLAALRAVLPALILLAAAALAVHQRDRLRAWLEARLGRIGPTDVGPPTDAAPEATARPPTNPIERAWAELIEASGVDPDPSATPRECAEMLVRAGFDGDAVWELTRMFEEVRYDEAPVGDDCAERARRCLQRSAPREVTE